MKRQKNILFSIFLFLGVLFCFEIQSYNSIQAMSIEFPSGSNDAEKCISSESDTFDHDQINYITESFSLLQIKYPIAYNSFTIQQFPLFIWQPPKIA